MTSGPTSYSAPSARMRLHCAGSGFGARHMRGLAEKIWHVLAPISWARRTALEAPPAVPRWTPIRFVIDSILVIVIGLRRFLRAHPDHRRNGLVAHRVLPKDHIELARIGA